MSASIAPEDLPFEDGKTVTEEIFELNIFKNKDADKNYWCFHDIHLCDYDNKKVLWERKAEDGSFLDVYNPEFKSVTFSELEPDDEEDDDKVVSLYKVPSTDGKYILGYNPDLDFEENKPRIIPFEVKSVVSLASSLFNMLDRAKILEKYGKITC